MTMRIVAMGLSLALCGLAWQYASASARHRPVALFLSAQLLADVVRRVLAILNAPAYVRAAGAPLTGLGRLNFHVDELLQLTWPASLAAVAALVWLEEPARRRVGIACGLAWALAGSALILGYPTIRRAVLGRCYLAAELVGLATVIVCGVSWWRRREEPSLIDGSIMVLGGIELAALVRWSPFGAGWDWQATAYCMGYGVLAVLHGGELWSVRSQRSS
jgi:hypothetical protein